MSIDYESLKFTDDDDEEKLLSNRNKIASWISFEIIPFILPDECISIDYGADYRCPRTGNITSTYHLDVCGGKSILSSHNGQHILIAHKFGNYEPLTYINDCNTIYALVDNWPMIKTKLLNHIELRKDIHDKIQKFEV